MKPAISGQTRSQIYPRLARTGGRERRKFHRHDLEMQGIVVHRFDSQTRSSVPLGKIVDISANGVRFRMDKSDIRPEQQIRVRLELPTYAGISPFIAPGAAGLEPKREWIGWITVSRIIPVDEKQMEVGGRMVDMHDMDRGMLGLYLSTQPMAA